MSAVKVSNLSILYHQIPALWDINFEVPEGTMVAIIGPNGAGKSTLLKSILNLIKVKNGEIEIMGTPHHKLRDKHKYIAYMPQRSSIDFDFPTNVIDVVMMGRYGHLGWFKRPGKNERELAMNALKKFGMAEYSHRQIGELSGGQKQRVFLARAYIQQADIYFLDEPFGGVDSKTEQVTLDLLKELKDNNKTIIVVTHELDTLKAYFDYIMLINTQKIAFGTPSEVLTAENMQAAYGGLMHMPHR